MEVAIDVRNLGKLYRLGQVGTGTLSHDLKRWWYLSRGKEDPFAKIGSVNDRTKSASRGEYVWALRDISFQINKGEVVGVIGKNGAGKSTLLKILSRITAPTHGYAKLKGRVGSLLEVGTGFHPEMTGRENVYMNGTVLGMRRREITGKFEEIIEFAGVAKYVDTPVKRYSSGMMVRLGFAVAAFLEPEILIVDEVLAVGDAEFQKKAIGKMQDVSKESGRTVLFVSHNMESVMNLCNSGMVIENGNILFRSNDISSVINTYQKSITSNLDNGVNFSDRKGLGNVRITDIKIKDSDGDEYNEYKVGSDLRFEIHYESEVALDKCRMIIGVYDSLSLACARLDSLVSGDVLSGMPTRGMFCCDTANFNLAPGTYFLNIALYHNDRMEDYLFRAKSFTLFNADYFGSGKSFEPRLSKTYIRHKWQAQAILQEK